MSIINIIYLVCIILFILSLQGLSTISTSKRGNLYTVLGMSLAIITSLFSFVQMGILSIKLQIVIWTIILGSTIGCGIAHRINMKDLPQLVAAFHSLIGLAAMCLDSAIYSSPETFGITELSLLSKIEISLGIAIGAITFSGSLIAFGKLQGLITGKTNVFKNINIINISLGTILFISIISFINYGSISLFVTIILVSLLLGYYLIIPIGGADMPVVVSILNSYSGWAATGIGLITNNYLLITVGALVGTSGAILSNIMCKGMNRSLVNVLFCGGKSSIQLSNNNTSINSQSSIKKCSIEDASYLLSNSNSVIIVPGYGMAVSQAQHALKELTEHLKSQDVNVKFAIHPVAGRMPGHMNVLLAEANINDDDVFELEDINHKFSSTDITLVVGANDITNPAAKDDPTSPIYGMPILEVWKSTTVIVIKRSLNSGYAGIENSLFYKTNTLMLLGDAKKILEQIIKTE